MSLTTDDLKQIERLISKGFADGFQHYVVPYVDAKIDELRDELGSRIDGLEGRMDGFQKKMDNQFLCLNEKIDENTALIGYYFEQCATKKAFANHEKRIRKLELARS